MRFPINIPAGARVSINFTVAASEVPKDDEGKYLIQISENAAAAPAGSSQSKRVFGGPENMEHEWVGISLPSLESGFMLSEIDMVPNGDEFRVRTRWVAKSVAEAKDFGEAGVFAFGRMCRMYNHATVYKNFGGQLFVFNLLGRPMRTQDRFGNNLNRSPKWTIVPVLAEEAAPAVPAVEKNDVVAPAAPAESEKFGMTNLGALLKAKLGVK